MRLKYAAVDELRMIGSLAATIQQRGYQLEKITCTIPDCRSPVYLIDKKFSLAAGLRLIKYHLLPFIPRATRCLATSRWTSRSAMPTICAACGSPDDLTGDFRTADSRSCASFDKQRR